MWPQISQEQLSPTPKPLWASGEYPIKQRQSIQLGKLELLKTNNSFWHYFQKICTNIKLGDDISAETLSQVGTNTEGWTLYFETCNLSFIVNTIKWTLLYTDSSDLEVVKRKCLNCQWSDIEYDPSRNYTVAVLFVLQGVLWHHYDLWGLSFALFILTLLCRILNTVLKFTCIFGTSSSLIFNKPLSRHMPTDHCAICDWQWSIRVNMLQVQSMKKKRKHWFLK